MSGLRVLGRSASAVLAKYYNGPDHPAKLRIFDALMRMAGQPRLTVKYAGAGLITVDVHDLVARSVLSTGAYEPEVWAALSPHVPAGAVVWDAGAHIGTFAIRAMLDGRVAAVHAFEPDPAVAAILRYNLALNDDYAVVHELALLDTTGRVAFETAPAANTGIGRVSTAAGTSVAAGTVDELVFSQGVPAPAIMKIDVEGSEIRLLRGAARLLAESPPRAIAVEAPWDVAAGLPDARVLGILANGGYQVTHIARADGHLEERENMLAVLRA